MRFDVGRRLRTEHVPLAEPKTSSILWIDRGWSLTFG
jgi:hypothetical protein